MTDGRILVLGDDAQTRESLVAGLRADGYTVDAASSVHEALDLARRQDYTVSLLDCGGGDGCETRAELRRLLPQCLVIGLNRITAIQNLRQENAALREQLAQKAEPARTPPGTILAGMTLKEMEKILITATIQHTRGNIKEAASVLGIDRSTLYEKIRRYGIPR